MGEEVTDTKDKLQVGRLAMRQEGEFWAAYYALEETMDDAIFLGSIRMGIIAGKPKAKEAFMDLMRSSVSAIIEGASGIKPQWGGEKAAPEHERSGNA